MLNADTRAIIREIEENRYIPHAEEVKILANLVKLNIVRLELTSHGKQIHHEIMASGDGPEALKELFR